MLIDEKKIFPTNSSGNEVDKFEGLHFSDGNNFYSFSKSKSTLFKKFDFSKGQNSPDIAINILDDPFDALKNLLNRKNKIWTPDLLEENSDFDSKAPGRDFVVLPLYSTRGLSKDRKAKNVPPRSGINQWNAKGRVRHFHEAYIPIPSIIHLNKKCSKFFPSRDVKFNLTLPNGRIISAKVCQDGGKALMSDPNKDLGSYLFSVLDATGVHEKTKKPLEYDDLFMIGKDSVKIYKHGNSDLAPEKRTS